MNKNQIIAMAQKNLKVKDLSFRLNLHAAYVSGILAGRHKPAGTRSKICDILGKPEDYLWPEEERNA